MFQNVVRICSILRNIPYALGKNEHSTDVVKNHSIYVIFLKLFDSIAHLLFSHWFSVYLLYQLLREKEVLEFLSIYVYFSVFFLKILSVFVSYNLKPFFRYISVYVSYVLLIDLVFNYISSTAIMPIHMSSNYWASLRENHIAQDTHCYEPPKFNLIWRELNQGHKSHRATQTSCKCYQVAIILLIAFPSIRCLWNSRIAAGD